MANPASIHPQLELHVSRKARRMALRLDSQKRVVRLVVPPRISQRKALEFARDHASWIREKLAALPSPVRLADGVTIPVFGVPRTITVDCDPAFKRTAITLAQNKIIIQSNRIDAAGRLVRYLKRQAKERMTGLAAEKAARIGKQVASVQVRDTKSRWGSCGADGRLSFSWRLVFAPPAAMDYLVAHEVAHLVHMNHGKEFWALCRSLSEDYETGKRWLRDNGGELMRYVV